MKIFSAEQIRQWDAITIEQEGISSVDLMERAAAACTKWILSNIQHNSFKIFCGKGNNGGDGLAIARQLTAAGKTVEIFVTAEGKETNDFSAHFSRLQSTDAIREIETGNPLPIIHSNDVVIDCLFGTGLNRAAEDVHASVIEHINKSGATVISIDIPSGMFADRSSKGNTIIKAVHTLSFQALKLAFLVTENAEHFGQVHLLNIALNEDYAINTQSIFETIEKDFILSVFKQRNPFSHKGHHGHALLIAGSPGKMGACLLAAKACLRSGVGLLTCCVPKDQFQVVNIALPEAMTAEPDELYELSKYKVIGIGPGLGQSASAESLVNIIAKNDLPAVIDADALNMLSKDEKKFQLLPKHSVLTPHPKEFDRLFGESENAFERINKAIRFSAQTDAVLVLKDHYTLICYKGKGYFSMFGNAGLAKGGSGDVLTGIITALLAQGYSNLHAVLLGVYLQGTAADAALQTQSTETMLATDVIEYLGKAFKTLGVKGH